MIMLTISFLSPYVLASSDSTATTRNEIDKMDNNNSHTVGDSNEDIIIEEVTDSSMQEQRHIIPNHDTDDNGTCESEGVSNSPLNEQTLPNTDTVDNNKEGPAIHLSANRKNNYRYRAWHRYFYNSFNISPDRIKSYYTLVDLYLSGHIYKIAGVTPKPLSFSNELSVCQELMYGCKEIFTDFYIMNRYKKAYDLERKQLSQSIPIYAKIYSDDDTVKRSGFSHFIHRLGTTVRYVWHGGLKYQSADSLRSKLIIIMERMQEICDITEDQKLKDILAEVYISHFSYLTQNEYSLNVMKKIATCVDRLSINHKHPEQHNSERRDNPCINGYELQNMNNEKDIRCKLSDVCGIFIIYLKFFKEKQSLSECYNHICYSKEKYNAIVNKINESMDIFEKLIDQISHYEMTKARFWVKFMLLRMKKEIIHCFNPTNVVQEPVIEIVETNDERDKENIKLRKEKNDIVIFEYTCDKIREYYLKTLVNDNSNLNYESISEKDILDLISSKIDEHIQLFEVFHDSDCSSNNKDKV